MSQISSVIPNNQAQKDLIIVITGPTGVGKTDLSLRLAELLKDVEVISCDSMAVYREMSIGTTKPSIEARCVIPHHLIDVVSVKDEFNVAQYVELAKESIKKIIEMAKIPLIVGGSMMYLYSLLDGIFKSPGKDLNIRGKLKIRAEKEGLESLYNELQKIDPQACVKIHAHDLRRIIRALEVYYQTGQRISDLRQRRIGIFHNYDIIIYGLNRNRQEIYKNINSRVDKMIELGLEEEVKLLWKQGMSITAYQGHGYKEMIGYLEGKYSLKEAIRITKRNTRRYAKRQISWLRRDRRVNWLNLDNFSDITSVAKYIFNDLKLKQKI